MGEGGGAAVDVSCMSACIKSEGPFHAWEPVFSVWLGNVCNVDLARLVGFLSSFGPLSTPTTYGSLPLKYVGGRNSYAIVNYIRYADAMALIAACASNRVRFHPRHTVVARPRANVIFIQRVLGAGAAVLTFEHAVWLTKRMEDHAGFPGNAVLLLRSPDGYRYTYSPIKSLTCRYVLNTGTYNPIQSHTYTQISMSTIPDRCCCRRAICRVK